MKNVVVNAIALYIVDVNIHIENKIIFNVNDDCSYS